MEAVYASSCATPSCGSCASLRGSSIAALVRQVHPDWSVAEVKAAVVNTAGVDVPTRDGQQGPIAAPNRVGAGRVDAAAAVGNQVLAMVEDDDPVFLSKLAERLTPSTDPIEDIHYLIVLARLRAPRSASITSRTAGALLALDRKISQRHLNRDHN